MEQSIEKVEYKDEYCKYEFTDEELRDIAETLAIKTQELDSVEDEKKSVVSSFKERIETIQLDIKTAARKYKDRYEMRNIECIVERDFEQGITRYVRTDNGEVARTAKITMAERQRKIDEMLPVNREPGKQSGSDGGSGKSSEELRQEQEIKRTMASEGSSVN